MSWLKEAAGGGPLPPYVDNSLEDKVPDPHNPNRMVANKAANRPFLSYHEYREKTEALHAAWLKKKHERDEKIARGEKVGPLGRDPTAQVEVGLLVILKFIVLLLLFASLAGKFITGSYTWEYESKWTRLKTYWPRDQRLFSLNLLAEYDGTRANKPTYLAIDGDVYDVSKGGAYQPGGSYHVLAGHEGARAFGTGCFKTHRTHDTRGMSESELRSLAHWKKFYVEHKDYVKVGRVVLPPIDPASPIPEHCDPKKARQSDEKKPTQDGVSEAKVSVAKEETKSTAGKHDDL